MKPIIQWVPTRRIKGTQYDGYWACRHIKGNAYKSGVGRTPQEAYAMWAQFNEVSHV